MAKVASITAAIHAAGLTPTGLRDLLLQVDTEVAAGNVARLKTILTGLCNLPLTEGRSLLTEAAKPQGKDDSEKAATRKTQAFKTLKSRISQCRMIYGASKLIEGFRERAETMTWNTAATVARAELEARKLKADGGRVKTPAEIKAEKVKAAIVETLAENLVGVDVNDEVAVAHIAQQSAKEAESNMLHDSVQGYAERLVKAKGAEYALMVAMQIIRNSGEDKAAEMADIIAGWEWSQVVAPATE